MNTHEVVHASPDSVLDLDEFHRGFGDAVDYLESLPGPWACHHAATTLELPLPCTGDASHVRGYRAALFGYLRGGPLEGVPAPIGDAVEAVVPALPAGLRDGSRVRDRIVVAGAHTDRP